MLSGISPWSILLILIIVVVLFGTKKLRNVGADLGAAMKSFKKSSKSRNINVRKIKSYINPSHGAWDPVGTFANVTFLVPGERICNPVWYILESEMFTKPLPE
mgnify:CR=1 FL=1